MRYECRASGGSCGVSCNCLSYKFSNKEATLTNVLDYLLHLELGDCNEETERSENLASEGAKLLQSALAEKPVEAKEENEPRRKPLSDIGNTVGKSNAPKVNQRKKWRKSVIQLVPVAAPTPEAMKKPESRAIEAEIPSQLPRAMRSAVSNTTSVPKCWGTFLCKITKEGAPTFWDGGSSNLLRERNSEQSDVSVVNKDGSGAPAPTSPPQRQSMTDEKENSG